MLEPICTATPPRQAMPRFRMHTEVPAAAPDVSRPADPAAARIQARLEAIEAQPLDTAPRHRSQSPMGSAPGADTSDEELDEALDHLHKQLERAFVDLEARVAVTERRIAAADTRAQSAQALAQSADTRAASVEAVAQSAERRIAAAEALAQSADTRAASAEALAESADTRAQSAEALAQSASARSANLLYAVDDLAYELKQIAGSDEPGLAHLVDAVDRLRTRIKPETTSPPTV